MRCIFIQMVTSLFFISKNLFMRKSHLHSSAPTLKRKWRPPPVFLPEEPHGQRSLVGYSPRGCKESDTTECLHFHFSFSCTGEGKGNGTPLQYSCLENPIDGGAW